MAPPVRPRSRLTFRSLNALASSNASRLSSPRTVPTGKIKTKKDGGVNCYSCLVMCIVVQLVLITFYIIYAIYDKTYGKRSGLRAT